MILEVLCVILGLTVVGLAWGLFGAKSGESEAKEQSRAYQADAAVNRARAEKFKSLLEKWGGDVEDAERQLEAAHGGQIGPAVSRFNDRVRRLRENADGGKAGPGGEGGGVPPTPAAGS
jgi:hypothetical protein